MKIKRKVYQRVRERVLDMLPNRFANTSLPDCPVWAPGRAGQPQASPLGQGTHRMAENTPVTYSQAARNGGSAGVAESHMTVFFPQTFWINHTSAPCGAENVLPCASLLGGGYSCHL